MNRRQLKSSRALSGLEAHYRMMEWYYLKYWETVYHPLWRARENQKEIMSEKIRSEATVLYARYLHDAESYMNIARQEWKSVLTELARLGSAVKAMHQVCPAPQYQNCVAPRIHEMQDLISSLKIWLQKNNEWNEAFSVQMLESQRDLPSDHQRFESRFHADLEVKRSRLTPLFLRHLRGIREKLEFGWHSEECCGLCKPENLTGPADPVFQEVKLSYQGHKGVSGNVVNRADLVNAFEEYDMLEKEPKKELREEE